MKCPKCGAEHYREDGSISTLLGTYTEYKDGKIIQRNPNITKAQLTCLECGEHFEVVTHYSQNESWIGYPEQPLLKCNPMTITVSDSQEVLNAFNRIKTCCQSGHEYVERDEDLEILERFIKERS